MASGNFERCLAITLKWEGGYSNHPDDPGGPTMKGIIQREYDTWRIAQGKSKRPVREIDDSEVRAIYRQNYWDAMMCEGLPFGIDLCVFDAAVNSGVARARAWLTGHTTIDDYCDRRLAFLKGLGRLWRVFGAGWARRVAGIRAAARQMRGEDVAEPSDDGTLHAGMKSDAIRALQAKLRALGYPCGAVDGVFGMQTYRAVLLFQEEHGLGGAPGVWLPSYKTTLTTAGPMLPARQSVTRADLERKGDEPIRKLNLLQRIFAWVFGASTVAQVMDGGSVVDSMNGVRNAIEPMQGLLAWTEGHRWMLLALCCVAVIALVRALRRDHVEAYRRFDYQGPASREAA